MSRSEQTGFERRKLTKKTHFSYLALTSELRLNYFALSACRFLRELGEKEEEINKEARDGLSSWVFLITSPNVDAGKGDLNSLLSRGACGPLGFAPEPRGWDGAAPTHLFPCGSVLRE